MAKTYIGVVNYFFENSLTRGFRKKSIYVWNFGVLVRPDGDEAFVIPVEIEGEVLNGMLSINDEVELKCRYKKGKVIKLNQIFNRSLGRFVGR